MEYFDLRSQNEVLPHWNAKRAIVCRRASNYIFHYKGNARQECCQFKRTMCKIIQERCAKFHISVQNILRIGLGSAVVLHPRSDIQCGKTPFCVARFANESFACMCKDKYFARMKPFSTYPKLLATAHDASPSVSVLCYTVSQLQNFILRSCNEIYYMHCGVCRTSRWMMVLIRNKNYYISWIYWISDCFLLKIVGKMRKYKLKILSITLNERALWFKLIN